jgi:predicted metal-dependent hydrolase
LKAVPHSIEVGEQSVPVFFVRHGKARRYILRLLPNREARVTIPRGGSREYAVEFLRKNTPWLERQLRATEVEWGNGTEIWFRGERVPIQVQAVDCGWRVRFAGTEIEVAADQGLREGIERHLRGIATVELTERTLELAKGRGMEVRAVTVRNQRSRWGSCSVRRTISLNWRLIQTPDFVRDYIILHELMHLKEMNHSARFWAQVEAVCPGYMEAERWLKENSRLLR